MSNNIPSAGDRLTPRHRIIVDAVARGEKQGEFYHTVYGGSKVAAENSAARLMARPDAKAYLAELQEAAKTSTVLSAQERREILAEAARGGVVDQIIIKVDAEGKEVSRTTKTIPKSLAVQLDAKLSGDLREGGGDTLLLNLGGSVSLDAASASVFDGWGLDDSPAIEVEAVEVDLPSGSNEAA